MYRFILSLVLVSVFFFSCDDKKKKEPLNNTNNANNLNNINNTNNTNNPECLPFEEPVPGTRVAVLTADMDNGALSVLDLFSTPPIFQADLAVVNSDATVRAAFDRIYVINRLGGDNIIAFDDETFSVLWQKPLGPGSNPQDLAVVSSCKAYVSLYQKNHLQIMNPLTSENAGTTNVSLVDYADEDGSPEASFMLATPGAVYVAIQNLENFVPTRNGRILVVNTDTDAVTDVIELNTPNPFSPLTRVDETSFVVGTVGDFSGTQGGIEHVHGNLSHLVVTAEQLGGVATELAMQDDACGFALVNTPEWSSGIRPFCLDGTVGDWLVAPGLYTIVSLLITGDDRLLFGDATFDNPGLRLVDTVDNPEVSGLIPTGLAPGFAKPFAHLP